MKIEAIRIGHASVRMASPMRTAIHETTHTENALVEVHAEGLVGQGAALTFKPNQARAICGMIADLGEGLLGRDALDVRALWEGMWLRLNLTGQTGIGALALSALDTALWDLLARQAGMPLYRLLGAAHAELPVYTQGGWLSYSIEELVEEALSCQEEGYRHYKMRVGSPDWRNDVARVERVREALDQDVHLLVDANQGWSTVDAVAATQALDNLGLYWIEEPVDMSNVEGCARVAAHITTPVAAGEAVFGTAGFRPLIEQRAAGILMPDLQHCAGPSGFMRVATQADLANLPISSHLFTQVSIHLLAACRNALIVEYMPGWWDGLFESPLDISGGVIRPPQDPGIGYLFSEAASQQLTTAWR